MLCFTRQRGRGVMVVWQALAVGMAIAFAMVGSLLLAVRATGASRQHPTR